jgi:hypothetical protein
MTAIISYFHPSMPPVSLGPKVTPLLRFLRAMTSEQRENVARACGTTVVYLYQLAAAEHPNPRVKLALAICAESRRLSRKLHSAALTLPDLLVGTGDPHDQSETPEALRH